MNDAYEFASVCTLALCGLILVISLFIPNRPNES